MQITTIKIWLFLSIMTPSFDFIEKYKSWLLQEFFEILVVYFEKKNDRLSNVFAVLQYKQHRRNNLQYNECRNHILFFRTLQIEDQRINLNHWGRWHGSFLHGATFWFAGIILNRKKCFAKALLPKPPPEHCDNETDNNSISLWKASIGLSDLNETVRCHRSQEFSTAQTHAKPTQQRCSNWRFHRNLQAADPYFSKPSWWFWVLMFWTNWFYWKSFTEQGIWTDAN